MAYTDVVLADSPIAYWPLQTNFNDSSGNGKHLTPGGSTGPVIQSGTGPAGGPSAYFVGGSTNASYASITDTGHYFSYGTYDAMTWELWFKTDNWSAAGYRTFFSKDDRSNNQYEYEHTLGNNDGAGRLSSWMSRADGSDFWHMPNYDIDANDGNWHHFVITMDGKMGNFPTPPSSPATIKVYYDNVDITAVSGVLVNKTPTDFIAVALGRPFMVGQLNDGTNGFTGWMSHIAVYDYALTAGQVGDHYDAMTAVVDAEIEIDDPSEIDVDAQDADVAINAPQEATSAQIVIDAADAEIDTENGDKTVVAETPLISVIGQDAAVVAEANTDIEVDEPARIDVNTYISHWSVVIQNYDQLIASHNPSRWYKFSNNLESSVNQSAFTNLSFSSPAGGVSPAYGTQDAITGTNEDIYLSAGSLTGAADFYEPFFYSTTAGSTTEFFIKTNTRNGIIAQLYRGSVGSGMYTTVQFTNIGIAGTSGITYRYRATVNWYGGQCGQGWSLVNGYLSGFNQVSSAVGYLRTIGIGTSSLQGQPGIDQAMRNALSQAVDVAEFETDSPFTPVVNTTTSQAFISDGAWHHIAIVALRNDDGSFDFKTYVDGSPINVFVGLPNLANYGGSYSTSNRFVIGRPSARWEMGTQLTPYLTNTGPRRKYFSTPLLNRQLDEWAVYNYGLTAAQVLQHSSQRNGTIIEDNDKEIAPDTASINLTGKDAAASIFKSTYPDTSNIRVRDRSVSVSTDGTFSYGADNGEIAVNGQIPTVIGQRTRNVILDNQPGGVLIKTALNFILATVDDLSFFFVPPEDTSISAREADHLLRINMGAFLFSQEKVHKFRIANTSAFNVAYRISALSINTEVINQVQYSLDGNIYADTIITEAVPPLQVSGVIYVRLSIPTALSTGAGNFLVNVEPLNVDVES